MQDLLVNECSSLLSWIGKALMLKASKLKYLFPYKWFWIFFYLISKNMGQLGDGKQNILWVWYTCQFFFQ